MVGVEYMNDDPAEVDILYGKVYVKDGSRVLQEVADGVVDHFSSKGLCSSFSTLSAFTYATLQPCRTLIEISLPISV
jgi:fluoride ion exporter CrcB/FEX